MESEVGVGKEVITQPKYEKNQHDSQKKHQNRAELREKIAPPPCYDRRFSAPGLRGDLFITGGPFHQFNALRACGFIHFSMYCYSVLRTAYPNRMRYLILYYAYESSIFNPISFQ